VNSLHLHVKCSCRSPQTCMTCRVFHVHQDPSQNEWDRYRSLQARGVLNGRSNRPCNSGLIKDDAFVQRRCLTFLFPAKCEVLDWACASRMYCCSWMTQLSPFVLVPFLSSPPPPPLDDEGIFLYSCKGCRGSKRLLNSSHEATQSADSPWFTYFYFDFLLKNVGKKPSSTEARGQGRQHHAQDMGQGSLQRKSWGEGPEGERTGPCTCREPYWEDFLPILCTWVSCPNFVTYAHACK